MMNMTATQRYQQSYHQTFSQASTDLMNDLNPEAAAMKDRRGEPVTGTTIMAVPFRDGVILAADSRVSTGAYIANRVSDKVTPLLENGRIWCCRSGSAADTQALTDYVRHYLAQLSVEMGRQPTVKTAAHLLQKLVYENKNTLLAGMIVGGWDEVEGGTVYSIPLGGSCLKMPYVIGGSGSTYIYGLVDSEFDGGAAETMDAEAVRALVTKCVAHAMARDGSSGGVIRTVTVTEQGAERHYIQGDRLPYGP